MLPIIRRLLVIYQIRSLLLRDSVQGCELQMRGCISPFVYDANRFLLDKR